MSFLAGLIGLLAFFFILVAVLGVIAPSIFKDKKTGEIPKRGQMFVGGLVAAALAFVVAGLIAPEEATSETPPATKENASTPSSAPVTPSTPIASAEKSVAPMSDYKKPLDLAEARLFAKNTLRIINEAEQSLNDGIQLGDAAGIAKHVRRPLQLELEKWPTLVERQPNDQREHFSYCHDAAMKLQVFSYTVQREQTVESMKYLRKDEAEYRKAKQRCEQQLAATDNQIKASVAAEDAELKKKFGGRECLSVFDMDKYTGQVVEKPKPAHCKK